MVFFGEMEESVQKRELSQAERCENFVLHKEGPTVSANKEQVTDAYTLSLVLGIINASKTFEPATPRITRTSPLATAASFKLIIS